MESEFQYLSAIVPNEYYHDAAIFEKEKLALFQNSWIFIGMSMNLENHNDFLTDEIGGVSVVVQNFRGTLRAFHNVCTHRFNKIQNAKQGNRALICEYHGWNYNTDGIPFGIPLKAEFKGLAGKLGWKWLAPASVSIPDTITELKAKILATGGEGSLPTMTKQELVGWMWRSTALKNTSL